MLFSWNFLKHVLNGKDTHILWNLRLFKSIIIMVIIKLKLYILIRIVEFRSFYWTLAKLANIHANKSQPY